MHYYTSHSTMPMATVLRARDCHFCLFAICILHITLFLNVYKYNLYYHLIPYNTLPTLVRDITTRKKQYGTFAHNPLSCQHKSRVIVKCNICCRKLFLPHQKLSTAPAIPPTILQLLMLNHRRFAKIVGQPVCWPFQKTF